MHLPASQYSVCCFITPEVITAPVIKREEQELHSPGSQLALNAQMQLSFRCIVADQPAGISGKIA